MFQVETTDPSRSGEGSSLIRRALHLQSTGILFDEFAIGMINDKTTAVRIIPVHGKDVGEWADYGGLLGKAPVMPVSTLSNAVFARRGGRIPAPVRSLTN